MQSWSVKRKNKRLTAERAKRAEFFLQKDFLCALCALCG